MLIRLLAAVILLSLSVAGCTTPVERLRVATFNTSLFRDSLGALTHDLSSPTDSHAMVVAEIIQRVRPDIVLLNEFDYDATGQALDHFQTNYLAIGQNVSRSAQAAKPIVYNHRFVAPVNTGVASGFDLDNDGSVGAEGRAYGNDAFGFGLFPGQYGMVIFSRFPIDSVAVRTFRTFRWQDMPNALLPQDPRTGDSWFAPEELEAVRLSSKSHWDVPIIVGKKVVHLLASHPAPPVFDGPEDRNGRRNHDEIRFWADYVSPDAATYIYDDVGAGGGMAAGTSFVIVGDLNADPHDGDTTNRPISLLLESRRVNTTVTPASDGARQQSSLQGGINERHQGDPAFDTADFADGERGPGNLRLDYVLPSSDLKILEAGVFWPLNNDPLFSLVGTYPFPASDHRLVWIDVSW